MEDFIFYIECCLILLCFFLGIIFFNYKKNKAIVSPLGFFLLFILATELTGTILTAYRIPNLQLYNYSTICEASFYSWLVSRMYILDKAKRIAVIAIVIFTVLAILNVIFLQGRKGFHTITYSLGTLLVVICCIYYFYQIFIFPDDEQLTKKQEFWICTGLLLYYGCSFPIFCLNNFYNNAVSQKIWPIIGLINTLVNLGFYILLSIAFLCKVKIKKFWR